MSNFFGFDPYDVKEKLKKKEKESKKNSVKSNKNIWFRTKPRTKEYSFTKKEQKRLDELNKNDNNIPQSLSSSKSKSKLNSNEKKDIVRLLNEKNTEIHKNIENKFFDTVLEILLNNSKNYKIIENIDGDLCIKKIKNGGTRKRLRKRNT